jgi:putative peptidoglycan lipid II flippase
MKKGAILLGLSFLVSKVIGLIRDNMLAASFGAGNGNPIFNLDTYYAAFRLPDFLFNLMSYGVLSAAFVPIFVEILKKENRESAFKFSNEIFHTIGVSVLIVSGIFFIFTPQILKLFVPGFSAESLATTINLTRIMLISPFLFTIGSIAGGIQNSLHKFWGLALAPIFYNLGIIAGIVFFGKTYGVYGVTIGVVVGAFLNALVQLPGILNEGYKYFLPTHWFSPRVKEMILLSLPRIFGMSTSQISLIVDTTIASTLAVGSITIINFASNLSSLPMGVIGISVAVVSFGTLAVHAAEGNTKALALEISKNMERILFLIIPLTFGMATLRLPIVRLFLGRGKFEISDSIVTANTLGMFLSGLMFGALVFLLARGFYALKNTKTPVIIGIISVVVNVITSVSLTQIWHMGTYGLAIANSLANICNAVLLTILLSKHLRSLIFDPIEIIKFLVSGFIMAAIIESTKILLGNNFEYISYTQLIIETTICVVIGVIVYGGICLLLRCKTGKNLLTHHL